MNAWDDAPHRNLLLRENLEPVRTELENGGMVFGWHYYYAGGCGPTQFSFVDFNSFYDELIQSRPGDKLFVFSVDRLADRAILRLGASNSEEPISFDRHLAAVKDALAANIEVVFVWRHLVAGTKTVEHGSGILYGLDDQELAEALSGRFGENGELLFFLMDMLNQFVEGRVVNALAYGKRPNEAGLTPLSGPY